MFWIERVIAESRVHSAAKIKAKTPLVVRDEKTASGRIHVGSLRGVVIHGVAGEALSEAEVPAQFVYEINDFDPFDDVPSSLEREKFAPFLGKPLFAVPSPEAGAENYAEYYGGEFIGVIKELGFEVQTYRASDYYKQGKFNAAIKTALEARDLIAEIYERVSGGKRGKNWFPISVICEQCGKIGTTKVSSFDGARVTYECGDFVEWAKGCGHKGEISPYDGNAKLLWKVEWAAKFVVLDVDVEGAGKDHSTKGGARDIADAIAREVFHVEPPVNIPYEFFHIGGQKMSTSRGKGISAREMADLLPPKLLRFLMIYKEPARVIEFDPEGDTIPVLYDMYDRYAEEYFKGEQGEHARMFYFAQAPSARKNLKKHLMPRFSEIAYLVQMPHLTLTEEIEMAYGVTLSKVDETELEQRAAYAKIWLSRFAPPDYNFEIQKEFPEAARGLSTKQKEALSQVLAIFTDGKKLTGAELHTRLHDIKTETGIAPAEFFKALYRLFLGKESGPKAGLLLGVLDPDLVRKRLKEAIES
ncbi:MAG: lysine--tRNA ligase [bacterium]|nr:lysine--tRNA ligase [bacterium]